MRLLEKKDFGDDFKKLKPFIPIRSDYAKKMDCHDDHNHEQQSN